MSKTKTESPRFHCPDPPVGCGLSLLLLQKHPDDPEGRCVTCVNEGAPKEPPARRHDYGGFGEQWVARNDVLRRRLTGPSFPAKVRRYADGPIKCPLCRQDWVAAGDVVCEDCRRVHNPVQLWRPRLGPPPVTTEARRKCPRCLRQWVAPGDTICACCRSEVDLVQRPGPTPPLHDLPGSKPIPGEDLKAWRKVPGLEPVIRQSKTALPVFAGKSTDDDALDFSVRTLVVDSYERAKDVRLPGDTVGSARRAPGDPILEMGEQPSDLYMPRRPIEDEDDDEFEFELEPADLMVDEEILYDRDGEDAPANWETEAMRNLKNTGLCECEERCGRPAEIDGLSRRCYMRKRRAKQKKAS